MARKAIIGVTTAPKQTANTVWNRTNSWRETPPKRVPATSATAAGAATAKQAAPR